MTPRYFDTHSQLYFSQFDEDRDEVLSRMREAGVWTIAVGTSNRASEDAVKLAQKEDGIFATIGIHPTTQDETWDEASFSELVRDTNVVGVGECGLDYYRAQNQTPEDRERQRALFESHITFAHKNNLPLMLHCRPSKGTMDAYENVLLILATTKNSFPTNPGNVHFFVGTVDIARRFLDLGFTISFDGPITFTHEYDEAVRSVPLDRLLAETDAPFAAPAPHRGKRNEPSYVSYVVHALAEIREEEEEKVRGATIQNACRLWRI